MWQNKNHGDITTEKLLTMLIKQKLSRRASFEGIEVCLFSYLQALKGGAFERGWTHLLDPHHVKCKEGTPHGLFR